MCFHSAGGPFNSELPKYAIGGIDGIPCLLEWRTTEIRYPEEPAGLLVLDPQKICDSWAQEALKLH
jgi:hypothetical protein